MEGQKEGSQDWILTVLGWPHEDDPEAWPFPVTNVRLMLHPVCNGDGDAVLTSPARPLLEQDYIQHEEPGTPQPEAFLQPGGFTPPRKGHLKYLRHFWLLQPGKGNRCRHLDCKDVTHPKNQTVPKLSRTDTE